MKHPTAPLSIGLTLGLAISLLVTVFFIMPAAPAQSREPDKTLKLFFGHTGERGEFTFKRNGHYDPAVMARLNHFLRDWRKSEDAHIDPHLLDLVWAIYQDSGSHDYIHVVSAYRSPQTNEMLRRRSSGVAKNSQHRLGKAMDWFVTDVPLAQLRAVAMKMQGGGVGYYPRSGSPFIHTDTGNVRAWPRMSREQLIALFPNGNTLHLPADGKPLPGYAEAVAHRKAMGDSALAYLGTSPSETQVADRTGTNSNTKSWLARVFPGGSGKPTDQQIADAMAQADAASQSESGDDEGTDSATVGDEGTAVAAVDDTTVDTRMPRARPGDESASTDTQGPIVVASADAAIIDMLVMPALVDSGATPSAEEVGIGTRAVPAKRAEDAIATLISPADGAQAGAPGKSVELAYAPPAAPAPAISGADRAILAAFAAVDHSDAISEPDPVLVAALTGQSDAAPRPADNLAITQSGTRPRGSGVILAASDLPAYDGDADALLDLIDASAPTDPGIAHLAMPKPTNATDLFVAPGAASEVADLRGEAGPPVDRFALAASRQQGKEQGFFTRLFASLIE